MVDTRLAVIRGFMFGIIYGLLELSFVHAPVYFSIALGIALMGVAFMDTDLKPWAVSFIVAVVTTFLSYNLWEYIVRL